MATKTQVYVCSDPICRTTIERADPVPKTHRCPTCGKFMYHKATRTLDK